MNGPGNGSFQARRPCGVSGVGLGIIEAELRGVRDLDHPRLGSLAVKVPFERER
jgi:hypothetical protein